MATQVQISSTILDALADSRGKTLNNQQKLDLVERVTDTVDDAFMTAELKAGLFNEMLLSIVKNAARSHVKQKEARLHQAAIDAAGDAAVEIL